MLQLPLQFDLDAAAQFENFFATDNQQLLARLQQAASGGEHFVYVYGETGTGKSHLAQACCHQASALKLSAAYIPFKEPALEPELLDGLEQFDLLVIDDIQCRLGDADWEEALFDLYNRCKESGTNLVFFSRYSVLHLGSILADLHSRLSAMEIYQVKPIVTSDLKQFLIWRAARYGLTISEELAHFLLSRVPRDTAHLVQLLRTLDRSSLAHQRKLTIPFVKQILGL